MKVQGNRLNHWDTGASAHTTRRGGQMPPLEKYLLRMSPPPWQSQGGKICPPWILKISKNMAKCKICIEMVKIRGEKYRSFFFAPSAHQNCPPLGKSPEDAPDGTDFQTHSYYRKINTAGCYLIKIMCPMAFLSKHMLILSQLTITAILGYAINR